MHPNIIYKEKSEMIRYVKDNELSSEWMLDLIKDYNDLSERERMDEFIMALVLSRKYLSKVTSLEERNIARWEARNQFRDLRIFYLDKANKLKAGKEKRIREINTFIKAIPYVITLIVLGVIFFSTK